MKHGSCCMWLNQMLYRRSVLTRGFKTKSQKLKLKDRAIYQSESINMLTCVNHFVLLRTQTLCCLWEDKRCVMLCECGVGLWHWWKLLATIYITKQQTIFTILLFHFYSAMCKKKNHNMVIKLYSYKWGLYDIKSFDTILSVKFEPLCIRPIMSTKADKGDRKREIEQSPMKKKFRDSAISSEDLDSAIASRIELAFKEHQSTLNSVVNAAVRDAMDSVLIPALRELREDILATNKSVKELREEFEAIVTKTKQTRDRVDSVQAAAREDKRTVTDLKDQLERLTEKMTDMEDRCRRNNVRLVGLPEGMEGPDAAGFLRANLSKWIPSLRGRDIEIDRAHRVYDGGRGSDRPRTLIFRVLRWHDRSGILKGARQVYPVKCAQNNVTLLFFPDFSPATAIRRKAFGPVLKKMTALGLHPFLIYPAVIKLRHKGEQRSYDSPQKAEDFISSMSQQKSYAAALRGSSGRCFSSSTGGAWWPGWTWP